jgi:hypothetical protein
MLRCGANCFDCTTEMRRIRDHAWTVKIFKQLFVDNMLCQGYVAC